MLYLKLNRMIALKSVAVCGVMLGIALLQGCTKEATAVQVTPMVEAYFAAWKSKDYDKMMTFYAKEFFDIYTREDWLAHLQEVNTVMGELQTVKMKRSEVSTVFSGRRFTYEYSNRYANGAAKELVIVFQSVKDHEIKIQIHKIESSILKR